MREVLALRDGREDICRYTGGQRTVHGVAVGRQEGKTRVERVLDGLPHRVMENDGEDISMER